MAMAERYRTFSQFLNEHFDFKVQKISINAGFTCPNRDGTVGRGGCTYCNNQTFNPAYCTPSRGIASQIEEGKRFFARKYPDMKYLAYFQAYTGTYGELERLKTLYEEALDEKDVVGIIIGTRPDCLPAGLLDYLQKMAQNKFVLVELGAESAHDRTLDLINRCHTWQQTVDAVHELNSRRIMCGLHMIMGLPEETETMMLESVDALSHLSIDTVKFHQLQVVKGTRLAADLRSGLYDITRFSIDSYIKLCGEIIRHLSPCIAVERFTSQSPDELLIEPRWGIKNYEFTHRLNSYIDRHNIQQGEKLLAL